MLIQENLRRATAELIILHLLLGEDLYGYQIVQKIKELSKGLYTLPEGTLYPIMHRLEKKGLVREYNRLINNRLRKYYHIEESGRSYYEEMLCEYELISGGIQQILQIKVGGNEGEKSTHA